MARDVLVPGVVRGLWLLVAMAACVPSRSSLFSPETTVIVPVGGRLGTPLLESYCAGCHTDGGKKASKKKLYHFNFSTYPPGGHHTATIGYTIREVLGQAGKKATMPYGKPGSVQGEDLEKIIAWTNAWEAAEKGGAHPSAEAPKDK